MCVYVVGGGVVPLYKAAWFLECEFKFEVNRTKKVYLLFFQAVTFDINVIRSLQRRDGISASR